MKASTKSYLAGVFLAIIGVAALLVGDDFGPYLIACSVFVAASNVCLSIEVTQTVCANCGCHEPKRGDA